MRRRRVGDTISIPGDYQYRVLREGKSPQRFWHQRRFQASIEMLQPSPGIRVLDVGCGSGVFANQIAGRDGTSVVAVDANHDAIRFARSTFTHSNLQFEVGRVDEMGFEDASFDRISFLEVIEHVYPEQALDALAVFHRLLRPGGLMVISTPNVRSLWPLLERALDGSGLAPRMKHEQHVAGYHPASLTRLCQRAGFQLRDSRTLFILAPWLTPLSWRLADQVHRMEQRSRPSFGSLLIQCFHKVETGQGRRTHRVEDG